jgi:hypothetical protein
LGGYDEEERRARPSSSVTGRCITWEAIMADDNTSYQRRRESFLTIFLTLFGLAGFLLFLIAVSGGFFFYVLLAVGGIALLGWVHYLLWGRGLSESTAGEREEAELRDQIGPDDEQERVTRVRRHS